MKKDSVKVEEVKKSKKETNMMKNKKARDEKDYSAMLMELVRDEVKKL